MTPANRPLPVAARKAAFGTCTTPATGCGRERSARGGAPEPLGTPQSDDGRETMKTPTPTPSRQAPPSVASGAVNRDGLVQAARADVSARRPDPAAVARLARWLDAGRRMIGAESAP